MTNTIRYCRTYSTTTSGMWATWSDQWVTTSSTNTLTNSSWIAWNQPTSASTGYTITSAYVTTDVVWPAWVSTTTANKVLRYERYVESDEERAARVERERVATAERAERERVAAEERAAAAVKAEELLLSCLDEAQAAEYRLSKQFHVTTASGRRYCIKHGRAHNVFEVDAEGRRVREYCGHVRDHVPDADNVLAQKLMLESDEEGFLRVANMRVLAVAAA